MDIFVGNLSFDVVDADLRKLFEGFGNVASAVVLMRKDKKTPKSRGFGFVMIPDEQQALAAIAALNEKEFMGRVLNVAPALPKPEAPAGSEPKEKRQPEVEVEAKQYPRRDTEEKKTWFSPVYKKPGTFSGGRRTRSFVKRRREAGLSEDVRPPRRKGQYNSMRWRKRSEQPKPWQKSSEEQKPWQKSEEGSRPWKKATGESKPWRKSEGGFKPWKKTEGQSKPWKKSAGESRPWQKSEGSFKPGKKTEGESKPWQKSTGESRPWKKTKGESKTWEKSTREAKPWRRHPARPKPSRFKGR